ncbi:transmembrane protein 127-like isoform X1 [Rhinatrema bivittatum]|uniref:transmembrane protein 127-like isoform X1 n=1 Tax=Rhinatrema bivittatum TaxID=194408 RepID=UPI0011270586|nr:transmembrane protein 127-like isoform X1 [Rhinatrema bivittatum]
MEARRGMEESPVSSLTVERVARLPPPGGPECCLPAAFLQCLAVVAMCAAVADPSWIEVYEINRTGSECCVFGVAYVLHLAGNFTAAGPNYLLNQNGITLMVLMAICCYLSILIGLLAFFLDFLLMKRLQVLGVKIAALLHIFTALSSATAVGLCSCLFVIIIYNTKEEAGQINFVAAFGESFFFGIFSFSVSVCAAVLSFDSGRPVRRTPPLRNIFLMIPNSPPKVNVLQTDNDTNSFKISSGKHLTFKMY